jgi:hypothetical protein
LGIASRTRFGAGRQYVPGFAYFDAPPRS